MNLQIRTKEEEEIPYKDNDHEVNTFRSIVLIVAKN